MKKAIVYLNQFFGQVGGEQDADYAPELREGLVGAAAAYQKALGDQVEVTHTLICGDNYMGSHTEEALDKMTGLLRELPFDLFFAGPAFIAGRYGVACGNICRRVQREFGVPVFTSMYEENPGVNMFRREMYVFRGHKSAVDMRRDVTAVCTYALKVIHGEKLLPAAEEGYFGRGVRKEVFTDQFGYDRVVDMLLKALRGEAVETEVPQLLKEKPKPAPALKDLAHARIALVTTGGVVPAANPDHIQSSSATVWGKYDVSGMDALKAGEYVTIHGGIDTKPGCDNPNVILPLDAMREVERTGQIGELYQYFYSTTGTGTSEESSRKMGGEIAVDLKKAHVDGVLFVST